MTKENYDCSQQKTKLYIKFNLGNSINNNNQIEFWFYWD